MHYKQFTYQERLCIAESLERDPEISKAEIAKALGRSRSSVSDEIKRNAEADGCYLACNAHERARLRATKPRGAYKKDNPDLLEAIDKGLQKKWSPAIIAQEWNEKPEQYSTPETRMSISHQTIYEIIHEEKQYGRQWYKQLPHGTRKRKKRYGKKDTRGRIKNRVGIENRPAVVDNKSRVGDWEGDSIVSGREGQGGLVSVVERKTQYLVLEKLENGTAGTLTGSMLRGFSRHAHLPCKTLTVDNGREFAGHEDLSKGLGVDVYFSTPYHAWERGLNEQVNGMIRWWFPKGTDFSKVSRAEVKRVEKLLNDRPRAKLGYRTPNEVMQELTVRLQI